VFNRATSESDHTIAAQIYNMLSFRVTLEPMTLLHSPWFNINLWDLLLLIAVSSMGVVIASLHDPRWKALVMSLPLPFTISFLSVGQPLDVTNIFAINVLLAYTHGVHLLHYRLRMPIILSIILSALGYCLIGGVCVRILPRTAMAFWLTCAGTMAFGAWLHLNLPARVEPGHRNPLPLPVKYAVTLGVVSFLIFIKQFIQGFMTAFPMVGVIAAYESRYSLWTNCRQIPILMLSLTPMMIAIYLAQTCFHLAVGWALALGWIALLSTLLPMTRDVWGSPAAENEENSA